MESVEIEKREKDKSTKRLNSDGVGRERQRKRKARAREEAYRKVAAVRDFADMLENRERTTRARVRVPRCAWE